MDFKCHTISAILFFSFLAYLFDLWLLLLLPLFLICVWTPDSDFKVDSHRNFIFHSILFPFIGFIVYPNIALVIAMLGFGFHCFCDLRIKLKFDWKKLRFKFVKVGGTYTAKYYKSKSIDGYYFANFWYSINFIISLSIFLFWMYFLYQPISLNM